MMGSGNSIPNGINITADDDMLKIIECPVCQEIPFPPIYMCVTGHNICKNCRPKLKECPMCKEVFTEKRNYTVEALVRSSKHTCLYNSAGCDSVLTGDQMEGHLISCQYKPRPCPLIPHLNCSESSLQLPGYRDHFRHTHNISLNSGDTVAMSFKIDADTLSRLAMPVKSEPGEPPKLFYGDWSNLIEFDGNTFFITMIPDYTHEMIYWTVLCFGIDKESEKYGAQITLTTDKSRRIQLTWRMPVYSILKGIKCEEAESNDVFQPSCSFFAFRKFITPSSEDENKFVVSAKVVIHKFKS